MELKDSISQLSDEEIRDARQMRPEDKFLEGARLFDRTCRIMKDGIRHEFPNASEDEVYAILLERLDLAERAESIAPAATISNKGRPRHVDPPSVG